jgi:hypothetical protein
MNLTPRAQLYEEMAFVAFHFHWSRAELMELEHAERRRWCQEVSAINKRLAPAPENPFDV